MEKLAEKISDAELEVMRVLWEAEEPLPISEIRLALQQRKGWEPTTTKTLVQRLCSKQALAQEKRNVFYYRPLISQEEYHGASGTQGTVHCDPPGHHFHAGHGRFRPSRRLAVRR